MCILPMRQKPEDAFKTPTYVIGGSDDSHTRQGGTNKIILPAAMVLKLLGITDKKMNRENKGQMSLLRGISNKCKHKDIFNYYCFLNTKSP